MSVLCRHLLSMLWRARREEFEASEQKEIVKCLREGGDDYVAWVIRHTIVSRCLLYLKPLYCFLSVNPYRKSGDVAQWFHPPMLKTLTSASSTVVCLSTGGLSLNTKRGHRYGFQKSQPVP